MSIGDRSGSDELTEEEFATYDIHHEEILNELRKVAAISDEAKAFLNTPFGQALRTTLLAEKLKAMKMLSNNYNTPNGDDAKLHYDIMCEVEKIFSLIVSDGEEALRQLQAVIGDDDE
mgnify:CR=1 FL=1